MDNLERYDWIVNEGEVAYCTTSKCGEWVKFSDIQSTTFLSREEFREIAVKHGVDCNVAIGLYWDVKKAIS